MTRTPTSTPDRPSKQRRYRRLLLGSVFGGVAAALVLRALDYPLLGEAVYWLGILAFLAIWRGTTITLFDERDQALERRASHLTLTLFAGVLVLGASAARVLSYTDAYAVPSEAWAVLWGYVALFAAFGVTYLWLRYRP
jgi:uncharacterized membrane protein YfcA